MNAWMNDYASCVNGARKFAHNSWLQLTSGEPVRQLRRKNYRRRQTWPTYFRSLKRGAKNTGSIKIHLQFAGRPPTLVRTPK
jgi:hypothetical protein